MSFSQSTQSQRSQLQASDNQLVVVVIKAQDLPNRRRLDKQSPYVVGRIQDQIQRTKVVSRGGQTPHFDQELWFSLENVEGTTLNLTIYHQQKKDSELVCQADIDFSTALRRSVEEGYDAWFPLQYKNKPAGRIYLEMTYYPSVSSVPIAVENVSRVHNRMQTLTRSANGTARNVSFNSSQNSRNSKKNPLMSSYNSRLPNLPDLADEPHESPDEMRKSIEDILEDEPHAKGGWFSKIMDNAYNINKTIPSFFKQPEDKPGKPSKITRKEPEKPTVVTKPSFQRQLSSPELVTDMPRKLFVDSSDEEEEDEGDDANYTCSPLHTPIKERSESFEVGQKVEFRASARGHVTPKATPSKRNRHTATYFSDDSDDEEAGDVIDVEKRLSSMRRSFNSKPLPRPSDEAPPPPKHLIPTGSERARMRTGRRVQSDSKRRASGSRTPTRVSSIESQPRTAPTPSEFLRKHNTDSGLSYSQIRRMKLMGRT